MAKPKNKAGSKSASSNVDLVNYTFLIDCHRLKDSTNLQESLVKIKDKGSFKHHVLMVCSTGPLQDELNEAITELSFKDNIDIIDPSELQHFLVENKNRVNDRIVTIDASALTSELNLNLFNTVPTQQLGEWTWIDFKKDRSKLEYVSIPSIHVINREHLEYVVSLHIPYHKSISYYIYKTLLAARVNHVEYTFQQIDSPFSAVDRKKNNAFQRLRFWMWWLLQTPLKEKNEGAKRYAFINESSYFRFAFTTFAVILFLMLSVFSFDAGISGDERTLLAQAKKSYEFFATFGEDQSALDEDGRDPMYAYGQSFDLITYAIGEFLGIEKTYELRHLFNTWIGYLAMLFVGLLATALMGWRAGLIAFLAMLLSPRFLGHAWNNPKDIPFAFGIIFTTYFIFKCCKYLPKVSFRNLAFIALGLAITISIRIGGLMLVGYLFLFAGLTYLSRVPLKQIFQETQRKYLFKLIIALTLACGAGYALGIVLWPYALVDPIQNPIKALDLMTNFSISLRQLFDGEVVWSDNLPWFYGMKYMLITIPLFIFAGVLLLLALNRKISRKVGGHYIFFLFFAFLFPILYTIYKDSNLYGGWRHLMFAYPPLVVLSALGINGAYEFSKPKLLKYAITGIFVLLAIKPVVHIFKNHPYQYVYYNEIQGGIEGAYGEYEMDYYFHSFKGAVDWLIENELKSQFDSTNKIVVGSNAPIGYLFKDHQDYVRSVYRRYYDRGNTTWDYMLVVNSYISADQLKQGKWPPSNTIHTVDVNGYPICAVLKRETDKDYQAYQHLQQQNPGEAIRLYEEALDITPDVESGLLNLAQAYQRVGMYQKAEDALNRCLDVYPNYDKAYLMMGVLKLQQNKLNEAVADFQKVIELNFKYGPAYYYLGLIYYNTGDPQTASQYLSHAVKHSPRYKPAYTLMAECLNQLGRSDEAQRYMRAAQSLQ